MGVDVTGGLRRAVSLGAALLVVSGTPKATAEAAGPPASFADAGDLRSRLGPDWRRVRTPSFRVFVREGRWPPQAALRRLEDELQRLGRRLEVPARTLASLRQDPIHYFLVDDPGIIATFGVGDVEGLSYPADRLIVSLQLPHEHELVHVLMHLALPERGAANQRFLQEGLASYLGGNGVDAAGTVLATADAVLDRRPVDLASLWTADGWNRSPLTPYERYAVAARFVQYLDLEQGGWSRLRQLARLLAGTSEEVERRPFSVVALQLEGVYGRPWRDLVADFERWRRENPVGGRRGVDLPARAADHVLGDARHRVRLWMDAEGWTFAVRSQEGPLDVELFWGERQERSGGVAAAPSRSRRYRLHIDADRLVLLDQAWGRTLLRWEDEGGGDPASIGTRTERVFRLDRSVVGEFDAPGGMGLWSRPVFELD